MVDEKKVCQILKLLFKQRFATIRILAGRREDSGVLIFKLLKSYNIFLLRWLLIQISPKYLPKFFIYSVLLALCFIKLNFMDSDLIKKSIFFTSIVYLKPKI